MDQLTIPNGWIAIDLDQPGMAAWADPEAVGFAPNFVVAHGPVRRGMTREEWNVGCVQSLTAAPGYRLIDARPVVVDGEPGALWVGVQPVDGHSVTLMQWSWLAPDLGRATTVTATCATADYARLRPLLEASVPVQEVWA